MQTNTMVASSIPFAPVTWWALAAQHNDVIIDLAEHYQKMSYRNRYYLAGPDGKVLMSIPLQSGRNQRKPVKDVAISNDTAWQSQHWKTIISLYRRSPFFEYYEHLIAPLFTQKYELLHDWSRVGTDFALKALNLKLSIENSHSYQAIYPPDVCDSREILKPQQTTAGIELSAYYQVFEERCGFQPDCSILDLLFCEGNYAGSLLS